MKKIFVFVTCIVLTLALSKVSFAQTHEVPEHLRTVAADASPELIAESTTESAPELSVEDIVGEARSSAAPTVLPFGYPPYPSVGEYPAYGAPYSYKRPLRQRRLGGRFAPPPSQPYPLPTPGAVPGAMPPISPDALPPYMGQVPPCQEMIGAFPPPLPYDPTVPPSVFYRPTPIKNFLSMLTAPRPYIGYNPYAGYPPFPGYLPPQ
jgi:hypothetical protein